MGNILKDARAWGEKNYPQASVQKHAAFANSVMYVMTRGAGGFGGPSVRELAATKALNDSGRDFTDFSAACQFVDPIVYGPLTNLHRHIWDHQKQITFDNDPDDVKQLDQYRLN